MSNKPKLKYYNPNTQEWEQIAPTKEEFDDALNEIDDLSQDIGNLNSLTTEEQSNLVGAINEIDGAIDTHRSDYTSFKTDVGSNVKLLELNFLDLLIARELESLSTEMDTGYWWDTLQDATKIQNVTGATVSGGKIITTAETSEVVWRVHDIGFLTGKIAYYMNRTKTTNITPVDTNANVGDSLLIVKAATITIS